MPKHKVMSAKIEASQDGCSEKDTYSAIEGVRDAVVFAKQEWERKPRLLNGRAQACFEKCCTTMNNHINVLSLLPLDNEYFSVLCGGIKLIIKASVNHKKVAEDFGDAIERVNSELEDCMDVCELQLTELSKLVAQLYGLIFHFLTCAMKWYKSRSIRKLLDSFNESFSDTFTPILEAIDYLKARIFRKVSYKSQAQIQKIGLSVTEILSYLREGEREKQEKRIARKKRYVTGADLNGYFDRLYERLAGDLGIQMLEANREADIYDSVDERQFVVMKDTLVAGKANRRRKSLKGMTSSKLYKRHDLQVWSRGLESHTTSMIDFLEPQSLRIDKQVANALEDWMKGTTPKTLCVCEPESSKLIAAAVAMRALEVGMPALCFFCDCTPELPMSPESRNAFYESMVVNLMYSLIRQLIDLLPNRFETKLEFTRSTFAKLDGAFDTWPRAKQVLDKLMKLAPQGMLAVIDGLDQLDLPEYHDCVEDILEILLRYTDQEHNKKRALKILLTTKESCSMIENCTTIDVISPRAAKPKHRYQNRRFLDLS
ncbi:hypothetical protein BJ878DRAFT_162933 [Calycina marina]|uniref:DUF7708 domain-containing protein n=1 Tax=Calycina marina TaxID=1763456 RepID=A0A9P8CDB6_9HELO|nr:hypothetical protein BJ878DRAFT_162933 [Calycina marina]